LPQNFQPSERPHGGGELDALGVDLAGERGDRVGELHIHIPSNNIVGGERPFGPVVPEQLLDTRLVDPGAGSIPRRYRALIEKMPAAPDRTPWRSSRIK